MDKKFGFIGGGNMAKAICEGMISKKLTSYKHIHVSAVRDETIDYWTRLGAHANTTSSKVIEDADVIFIAVKPHILPEVMADMEHYSEAKTAHKLFISILAGVTLETLESVLCQFHASRVIRVMPNTCLVVGEGAVIYSPGQQATKQDIELVDRIFSTCGMCRLVPEAMINSLGALGGCGIAYMFVVIEALSDGAVRMGVPRELATQFAAQAVAGAGKMVLETKKHPGTLKDEVCSPGGSTIAGIYALEKAGVRGAFMAALEASSKRNEELGHKK